MDVGPVSSAGHALELLEEAATQAKLLQRELNQMGAGRRMHSFRSVRWGVTVPTGNYSSARIDAEVDVGADQSPEEVLRELKSWVGQQAPVSSHDLEEMERQCADLQVAIDHLQRQLAAAEQQWRQVARVFERLGIPVPSDVAEDLPF